MVFGEDNQQSYVLGLLDTGTSGIFVKRSILNKIRHVIEETPTQLHGRYNSTIAHHLATFTIKLPDFTLARKLVVKAYVEDDAKGKHDIILGGTFCKQLGLKFDFQKDTVTWGDITIALKKK